MGTSVKIVLFVIWILSIIGLSVIGIRQATETAYSGSFIEEKSLPIKSGDTVFLAMKTDTQFGYDHRRSSDPKIKYGKNDERVLYVNDIRIDIKSTTDSIGKIIIEKKAEGNNHLNAKKRAEAIEYEYSFQNNSIDLNSFFTTNPDNKYRDQQIKVIIYVPEGTVLSANENVKSFYYGLNSNFSEIRNNPSHYYKILKNQAQCLDCNEQKLIEENKDSIISIDSITPIKTGSWEQEVEDDFNK